MPNLARLLCFGMFSNLNTYHALTSPPVSGAEPTELESKWNRGGREVAPLCTLGNNVTPIHYAFGGCIFGVKGAISYSESVC